MRSTTLCSILLLASCATVPTGTPKEVATTLIEDLDAGRVQDADDLFDRIADDDSYREKVYPVVFEAARERYAQGDPAAAAQLLRFMAPRYPDALSVREALLYSLFLERAQSTAPDPALMEELDEALSELRASATEVPVWVDLVAAQQAVDRGERSAARESLARFLERWEGQPPELLLYVEDLERYLRTP